MKNCHFCGDKVHIHCKICGQDSCNECQCSCVAVYPATGDRTYYTYCTNKKCDRKATSNCDDCNWNTCKFHFCICHDDLEGGGCSCECKPIQDNKILFWKRILPLDKKIENLVAQKKELKQRMTDEK